MEINPVEIERLLSLLAQTPVRITAASLQLLPERLSSRPTAEDWSANEILAHLRACADVWGKNIFLMLTQDHPTLRHISPRGYIKKTNYLSLDFHASLENFRQQRLELLKTLTTLNTAQWRRGATFTGTTLGSEKTVFSQAQSLASHESVHCEQIEELLRQS